VHFWRVADGTEARTFSPTLQAGQTKGRSSWGVKFSPDGVSIAVSVHDTPTDTSVRIWRMSDSTEVQQHPERPAFRLVRRLLAGRSAIGVRIGQ
jgi:hypothetical protein